MVKTASRGLACCRVITEAKYEVREKRANRTAPHPWIVLKLSIGITAGLLGYASYVYIGRLAMPMIRRDDSALGSRVLGIVFLTMFSVLLLMTLWTYEKVVLTSPGKAKDHIRKSSQPSLPARLSHHTWDSSNIAGRSYEDMHPTVDLSRQATINEPPPSAVSGKSFGVTRPRDSHAPSDKLSRQNVARHESRPSYSLRNGPDVSTGDTPLTSATHMNHKSLHTSKQNHNMSPPDLPPPQHSRRPPTTPVLLPEFRYCFKDELLKPVRAHHCRACGTCIMKYDHHCPWIGQCVGARNHKFFVNFLQWASLFCLWACSTTVAVNVKSSSNFKYDVDPHQIAIMALAGLFSIFATALLGTHVRLIMMNQTTVESLAFETMRDRERATLARLHPWYSFGAKRRTKKQWEAEWGRIGCEGNLWWLGSKRANWEAVMGENVWWWFLPIGCSSGDGMIYPTNPRFDEQGRWRRRKEWPVELQ